MSDVSLTKGFQVRALLWLTGSGLIDLALRLHWMSIHFTVDHIDHCFR